MSRLRIGIKSLACAGTVIATIMATVAAAGCAVSPGQVRTARAAAYDTDFAVIFNHTLAVVRSLYTTAQENPAKGIIRTSWHEVRLGNTDADSAYQRDFVRFDLHVDGPRPWRVRVRAQAARWDFANAMPAPLEGGDEPPWLQGRVEGLQVAIHERLADHAVTVAGPGASARAGAAPPAEDTSRFGDIPPAAARAVARVLAALEARDQEALGAAMHPAFLWNLGAPPSAQDAQVMWRADGTRLDALKAAIAAGCQTIDGERGGASDGAGNAGTRVTCPPASAAPGFVDPRATFAPGPDGTWTMRSFLTEE